MRHEVIDREHLAERDRQVHQPLQINHLGTLQFGHQPDHPEKKKEQRDRQPDQHDDQRRLVRQAEESAEQPADEARRAHAERAYADYDCEDRAENAAAVTGLVAHQPPAQPQNGFELVDRKSTRLNFCASWPSVPTTSMNLSSSEEPSRRNSSIVP